MAPIPHGEDRDKPPDNPDDCHLSHQEPFDVVINADSSDSEDDNEGGGGYMGYQMLAQDLNENDDVNDEDDNNGDESEEEQDIHVSTVYNIDKQSRASVTLEPNFRSLV